MKIFSRFIFNRVDFNLIYFYAQVVFNLFNAYVLVVSRFCLIISPCKSVDSIGINFRCFNQRIDFQRFVGLLPRSLLPDNVHQMLQCWPSPSNSLHWFRKPAHCHLP